MISIEGALLDFKRLEELATGSSPLHRLDPRAKVLTTVLFILAVVSFDRYQLSALIPFFVFPAVLIGVGNLPAGYLAKKIALVCPFALAVALFNPFFDRQVLVHLGPLEISGGWISCATVLVRAALTVGAAFILLALTGFPAVCSALKRLGMPVAFAVQLLFLYRYIFVLTEEAARASRARELRSFGNKGKGIASFASVVGNLLLRSWQRAERVHRAMLARGFEGAFPTAEPFRFGLPEMLFLAGWSVVFLFLRLNNASGLVGSLVTGHLP